MNPEPAVSLNKPTILLNWGYNRKGWIEPFEKLNHRFRFVYLFHVAKPENEVRCTQNQVIYWSDYTSPADLLKQVQPEKVVFMDIYTALGMSLNQACKKASIKTYYLQHGLYPGYNGYRQLEKLQRKKATASPRKNDVQITLEGKSLPITFLKSTLTFSDIGVFPKLALYFLLCRKKGIYFAARQINFSTRHPDYYICYSERNAKIHFQVDKPEKAKIKYIGTPEYDKFFAEEKPASPITGPFYLLIDQPFAKNQYYNFGISKKEVNNFYLKLAAFCRSQGARLVVKLHPENYADTWQLQHEDIMYVRDDIDQVALIKNCEGCFGIFSTLLIPAIYYKPCIIFRLLDSEIQEQLLSLGVAADLNYHTFKTKDIDFGKVRVVGSDSPEFIRDFIYKPDGKAVDRLAQILES